jgi:hypothetical protein
MKEVVEMLRTTNVSSIQALLSCFGTKIFAIAGGQLICRRGMVHGMQHRLSHLHRDPTHTLPQSKVKLAF